MGSRKRSPETLGRVVPLFCPRPFRADTRGSVEAVGSPWADILDDPEVLDELWLAHRTRGEAYRDGRVRRREVRWLIEASEEEMAWCSGARWLVGQRIHWIPRVLGARIPVQLFGPPKLCAPPVTSIIGVCADLCQLISIPAWTQDPEGEFEDRAVPMATDVDAVEASALVSCRYATLAKARLGDAEFATCLVPTRAGYRYRWRGLLRWAASRHRDDVGE